MKTLELKYLGGFSIIRDGKPVTDFKTRKGQALLCFLAVSGKQFSRSTLAGMFWMDMPESQALMNLRKVVSRLKSFSTHLLISREHLAFNRDAPYWLDVSEFENAAAVRSNIQRLQYAVSLYQGDFLDGFDLEDSPLFADWVRDRQAHLHEIAFVSLQMLVNHFARLRNYHTAIHFSRQLIRVDPCSEDAHRDFNAPVEPVWTAQRSHPAVRIVPAHLE